jgi:hypothetical protein
MRSLRQAARKEVEAESQSEEKQGRQGPEGEVSGVQFL